MSLEALGDWWCFLIRVTSLETWRSNKKRVRQSKCILPLQPFKVKFCCTGSPGFQRHQEARKDYIVRHFLQIAGKTHLRGWRNRWAWISKSMQGHSQDVPLFFSPSAPNERNQESLKCDKHGDIRAEIFHAKLARCLWTRRRDQRWNSAALGWGGNGINFTQILCDPLCDGAGSYAKFLQTRLWVVFYIVELNTAKDVQCTTATKLEQLALIVITRLRCFSFLSLRQ